MPELLSAYQFIKLDGLPLMRERLRIRARELDMKGTVLLASEGVNFSLGGGAEALDEWLACLDLQYGIGDPVINRMAVEQVPFLRLKVRIRPEIITFDPDLRPDQVATGQALSPDEWQRLLDKGDVQLVDTRNDYEFEIGTFSGAVNPRIEQFTEFRDWAIEHLDRERPVAMFCTGGVRCEKASAWLLANGYDQVFQLHGGILKYLQAIPVEQSRWEGECFVFDDRVSVDHALEPTGRPVCAGCRKPAQGLGAEGMPPVDDQGQCRACGENFSPGRLAGVRERVRQIALARSRGGRHLGASE
jgi:UPF0176 protein